MEFARAAARGLTILALSALAEAQPARTVSTTGLKPGRTIPVDLPEAQTFGYSVTLAGGQNLHVECKAFGPDLLVGLYAPGGDKLLEVSTLDFPAKTAPVYLVAGAAGDYLLTVTVQGRTARPVHYEVRAERLRSATAKDRKRAEAEHLFSDAQIERNKRAYKEALEHFERALKLYRETRDRRGEKAVLLSAGVAYFESEQLEKAVANYEQALVIARKFKDRRSEGRIFGNLSNVYTYWTKYDQALSYSQQALAAFRASGDRRRESYSLLSLGGYFDDIGQFEKALTYWEQALEISRDIGDPYGEARALNGIGWEFFNLSRLEESIPYFEQALPMFHELRDAPAEALAFLNIGIARQQLGQFQAAVGFYERALAVAREAKDRRNEAVSLSNIGYAYENLGQPERAIVSYQQALAIQREIKNRQGEGIALTNIGAASRSLKNYSQAIEYHHQALAIHRETQNRGFEAITLKELGLVYIDLGRNEESIPLFEQALTVLGLKDRADPEILNGLGNAQRNLHRLDAAIKSHSGALAAARETKTRIGEAEALEGLMEDSRASAQPSLAVFYGKQAVNTLQFVRADVRGLGADVQRSFTKSREKPYHTLAEILIAQGRLSEAEQVLALLKEEEYFEYIRREAAEASSLNRLAGQTPEEAEYEQRYREIGGRLMTIGAERSALLAQNEKKTLTQEQAQRLVQLEQDLAVGNQAFEHFLGELTQHFSAKPDVAVHIETLRETQGIMEDLREFPAGTVAIFTLIAGDKVYAILRTPDAVKAYEYPIAAAELNRKILEFRQVIQDPKLDPRPLAQELYTVLIAGMADDLRQTKAKTLMWSLDGALRYVPLAALYDGKQYLIEQYRISVMTLASNSRLKDHPDQHWKAAGFGSTASLPAVAAELAGIITTKPGDGGVLDGEIELDAEFTQQSMRQILLKRYPVVHIASHFTFQPGNDANSFLLMGDGGHLSLAELKTSANLFGGVQLLTLSACNTGVGDGAEVEGFGTLAQRQGAKAVVASLWPVADESTALLMREFYRIRESNSALTKLDALREAQLELLGGMNTGSAASQRGLVHDPTGPAAPRGSGVSPREILEFRHPYFWAPFFLMGNWL